MKNKNTTSEITLEALSQQLQELQESILRLKHEELRSIRSDIAQLQNTIKEKHTSSEGPTLSRPNIRFFFDRVGHSRKPFVVRIDGLLEGAIRLSAVRSAILLTLLLDLQDRLSNGQGIIDIISTITSAHETLDSSEEDRKYSFENIRVALYRFDQFCDDEKSFHGKELSLAFDSNQNRLELSNLAGTLVTEPVVLDVTTNDSAIAAFIDRALATSPLARVRKRKALYVPSGEDGFDRLLLELYDHRFPINVSTIYFRPAIQSYPSELLQSIGMSERNIYRQKIVLEAYESKRCSYREIMNYSTIWDLIRFSENNGFSLYPKHIKAKQVEEHLSYLIHKIETFESYHLILTDAEFPFFLGTYEILSGEIPERFTVFFRLFSPAYVNDVSVFVLSDPLVSQSVADNVFDWILAHPSTIMNRDQVIAVLSEVRLYLQKHGPLSLDASTPESSHQ